MATRPAMENPVQDPKTLSATGGARLGLLNATWPFARLTADANMLRLSVLGAPLTFTRESVLELSAMRGFFSRGLQIKHAESAYPKRIIFWCFNLDALTTGLRRLGWMVN
jgi:hypothetical protein